jgi:superfamily II DNA or RNA helicase
MAARPDVIIENRVLIAKGSKLLSEAALRERYEFDLYNEDACYKCPKLPYRPTEDCSACPQNLGRYTFMREEQASSGRKFYSLPLSDIAFVKKSLSDSDRDFTTANRLKRHVYPMRRPIKFTGRLYRKGEVDDRGSPRTDQESIVGQWLKHKRGIIQAQPRAGKCLVGSTIVNTDSGFTRLDSLIGKDGYRKANFQIDSHKGRKQVSHTYKERNSETFKIVTEAGFEIEGTEEHPVLVLGKDLKRRWVPLGKVKPGQYIVSRSSKNRPMWGKSGVTREAARLLGYLTANGAHVVEPNISTADEDLGRDIVRCSMKAYGRAARRRDNADRVPTYHLGTIEAQSFLRDMGYPLYARSADKHIPDSILTSPKAIVKEYLSAYFAMDSGANGKALELSTASERLARELQVLLFHGFNILATRRTTLKAATNSQSPKLRKYNVLTISGHEAYKFVKEFPRSKVAKFFGDRFNATKRLPQETNFSIPYLPEFTRKTLGLPRGTKNFRKFRFVNGEGARYLAWSMSNVGAADWPMAIDRMRSIGNDEEADRVVDLLDRGEHYEKIVKIRKSAHKKTVYDVTVPDGHAFTANCLVSHNTVMAVNIACSLGVRTVIVAHQFELLDQFYETFVRDTDMKPGQVEIVKSLAALKKSKADVVLINPHKFYKNMDKIKHLLRKFSLLVVDEVHTAAATIYAKVIGSIPAIYRLGLSATPDRKDSRSKLNSFLIGPVVAVAKSVTLKPTIEHYQVQAYPRVDYKLWSSAIGWMADSEKRNEEIVNNVFKDIADGHHSIIIPVSYKRHMQNLVDMLNARARDELDFRGELAVGLHSKAKRKEVLTRADNATRKKPCVLVAIMSIIKQGITLRSPTMLHAVIPMAANPAVGAPMARQCFYRVCTPVAGKKQPIVRVYIDNVTMFRNATRGLVQHELVPRSKGQDALYDLPASELRDMRAILSKPAQVKTRSGRAPMMRGGAILQPGGLWC